MHAFLYGALLALGLIIPLGMQNTFIFNQGVTQKKWHHALPSVLTAFLCDMLLIVCAVMGISLVVFSLPIVKNGIYFIGFVFLCYMGYMTWRNQGTTSLSKKPLSSKQQMVFATSVSLLNPHAILDSVAVIGTNSLNFLGSDKLIYTLACILVSLGWFLSLSLMGHYLKKIDNGGKILGILSKISSLTIWGAAFYLGQQFYCSIVTS